MNNKFRSIPDPDAPGSRKTITSKAYKNARRAKSRVARASRKRNR